MRIQYWKDSLDRIYEASLCRMVYWVTTLTISVGQGYLLGLSLCKQKISIAKVLHDQFFLCLGPSKTNNWLYCMLCSNDSGFGLWCWWFRGTHTPSVIYWLILMFTAFLCCVLLLFITMLSWDQAFEVILSTVLIFTFFRCFYC